MVRTSLRAKVCALVYGLLLALLSLASAASTITVTSISDVAKRCGRSVHAARGDRGGEHERSVGRGGGGVRGGSGVARDRRHRVRAFRVPGVQTIAPSSALPAIVEPVVDRRLHASWGDGEHADQRRQQRGAAGGDRRHERGQRVAAAAVHVGKRGLGSARAGGARRAGERAAPRREREGGGELHRDRCDRRLPARANASHGIEIAAAGPGMIGGTAAADRNVIAFNGGAGRAGGPVGEPVADRGQRDDGQRQGDRPGGRRAAAGQRPAGRGHGGERRPELPAGRQRDADADAACGCRGASRARRRARCCWTCTAAGRRCGRRASWKARPTSERRRRRS